MARLFEEHLIRACAYLDGAWRMQADPHDVGESEQWNLGLPNGAFTSVPSVLGKAVGALPAGLSQPSCRGRRVRLAVCRHPHLPRRRHQSGAGFNNKGILNEYRKPKLAYHAVRQCYREFARADAEKNGKGETNI